MKTNNNTNNKPIVEKAMGADNSIYEFVTAQNPDRDLERAADNLSVYIARGFDKDLRCSEIIAQAIVDEGVVIHPQSFILFTETMIGNQLSGKYPELAFIQKLKAADDLGLYEFRSGKVPRVVDTAIQILTDNIEAKLSVHNTPSQFLEFPEPPVPIRTPAAPVPPQLPNPTAPAPAEEYYTIRIPADDGSNTTPSSSRPSSAASSSGSDYSFDLDLFKENRSMVIALTLASFIIINGIAWYVRTYHKETLVPETVEDTNESELLYSRYEPSLFSSLNPAIMLILTCFFPTLMFYYTFRYYYYYRLEMRFNKHPQRVLGTGTRPSKIVPKCIYNYMQKRHLSIDDQLRIMVEARNSLLQEIFCEVPPSENLGFKERHDFLMKPLQHMVSGACKGASLQQCVDTLPPGFILEFYSYLNLIEKSLYFEKHDSVYEQFFYTFLVQVVTSKPNPGVIPGSDFQQEVAATKEILEFMRTELLIYWITYVFYPHSPKEW